MFIHYLMINEPTVLKSTEERLKEMSRNLAEGSKFQSAFDLTEDMDDSYSSIATSEATLRQVPIEKMV